MEEDVFLLGGNSFTPWNASLIRRLLCAGGIDIVLPVRYCHSDEVVACLRLPR